jgi:hypothetical protein
MKNYLLIGFIFLLAGCDLFDTRDAEKPDQGRTKFEQAFTPQLLISNLVNSLHDKSVENYLACFSDSSFSNKEFQFLATSSAISQFPVLSENWTKKEEEAYFNNMKTKTEENVPVTLSFTNQVENPLGDSLQFTANYVLSFPNNSGFPENYQGDLIFYMIRDSRSVWVIYYWQDIKTSTNLQGWSELKGWLAN